MLVEEHGGACTLCGYNRSQRALHFHHVDPQNKSFNVSFKGKTSSIKKMREEAAKCALVCSNCHAEIEDGLTNIPKWPTGKAARC